MDDVRYLHQLFNILVALLHRNVDNEDDRNRATEVERSIVYLLGEALTKRGRHERVA